MALDKMREGRSGSLGEAMERAEVQATEGMAQVCRFPSDYALFAFVGRAAVEGAKGMTLEQRSVYVATLERAVDYARKEAQTNTPGRLQAALDFGRTRKGAKLDPDLGFDDEPS